MSVAFAAERKFRLDTFALLQRQRYLRIVRNGVTYVTRSKSSPLVAPHRLRLVGSPLKMTHPPVFET